MGIVVFGFFLFQHILSMHQVTYLFVYFLESILQTRWILGEVTIINKNVIIILKTTVKDLELSADRQDWLLILIDGFITLYSVVWFRVHEHVEISM